MENENEGLLLSKSTFAEQFVSKNC